ncbi:MAG: class I SAM-dependent methyltransferase [Deltaproteobacteria bacterium]|nr:MAG: class I SAM-dependent methyltransferase [Deltaproteobacteria bacterium]
MHESLQQLSRTVASFLAIELEPHDPVRVYGEVAVGMSQLSLDILRCEQANLSKDEILEVLAPAREALSESVFLQRCQEWPRGYPGDFETIHHLYYAENKAPKGTLGYYCEAFSLHSASTQQHRNKLHHQAHLLTDLSRERANEEVHILSLASSSCIDLHMAMPFLQQSQAQIVVNDVDEDALEAARSLLAPLASQCTFHCGNAMELVAWDAEELGLFDCIFTGGLFDYLSDKHVVFLLKQMLRYMLKPGGFVFFTNIAKPNPFRPSMEYLGSWAIIERTPEDIERLVAKTGVENLTVNVQQEQTGLTHMVRVQTSDDTEGS